MDKKSKKGRKKIRVRLLIKTKRGERK